MLMRRKPYTHTYVYTAWEYDIIVHVRSNTYSYPREEMCPITRPINSQW